MADPYPRPPEVPDGSPDVWREPVRGGYPDPALAELSASEQLAAQLSGRTPAPPLSRLTGMRLVEIGEGAAMFEMPITDWLRTPQGGVSIGPLTIPADGAVACAILTLLPPRTMLSTNEFSLRLMAPVRPGGLVRARGRVIQRRTTLALAEVAVTDEDDELIAHGSSLCVATPIMHPMPPPPPSAIRPPPADAPPDPYLRPAAGELLTAEQERDLSGLELLRGQLDGWLAPPPIHHLTGLRLEHASADEVAFELPASEWFCAPPRGRVQGGVVALLAEAALSCAIQARLPAGTALAPIDLKVNYLRPLAADGRPARGRGWSVHLGRRLAVAHAEVHDADGRAIAVATGSAMLAHAEPAK
jgi:uncharacterized protein (TIGR00369 family)